MPVRLAPSNNTYIEAIIRKFESQDRIFLICNTTLPSPRIIYASDNFYGWSGFTRHEVMRSQCNLQLLHGPRTDMNKIDHISRAMAVAEEIQIEPWLYKKDGTEFLCKVILAPVRNEGGVVIMYILNFEDFVEGKDDVHQNPDAQWSHSNPSQQLPYSPTAAQHLGFWRRLVRTLTKRSLGTA